MTVTVNGERLELPDDATLTSVIRHLGLDRAVCATEVNRRVVPKAHRDQHTLREGDLVEVVTLVGGG